LGEALTRDEKEKLKGKLADNKDLFAWTADDMPGVNPRIMTQLFGLQGSPTNGSEKEKTRRREEKSCHRRSAEAFKSRLHQGNLVYHMAGQHSLGQKE